MSGTKPHIKLLSLVLAGRDLQNQIADIIHEASSYVTGMDDNRSNEEAIVKENKERDNIINGSEQGIQARAIRSSNMITEPQVVLAIAEVLNEEMLTKLALFLSNSIPVRNAELSNRQLISDVERVPDNEEFITEYSIAFFSAFFLCNNFAVLAVIYCKCEGLSI